MSSRSISAPRMRHALQKLVLQLIAGALQRHHQKFAVDLAHHFLHRHGVDQQQVVEGEHVVANGVHQRLFVLQVARISSLIVASMRFRISATERGPPCSSIFTSPSVFSFSLMTIGDARHDIRRNAVQLRDAQRYVGAQRHRQSGQQRGGLRGGKMRKDQRDGLRMLAFDEAAQLIRIGLLQGLEVFVEADSDPRKMVGDALGALRSKGVREHALGVIEAAAAAVLSRQLAELFQYRFGLAGRHLVQSRDGLADCLGFFVVQLLHHFAADLVSQSDQKYGGLLRAGDLGRSAF